MHVFDAREMSEIIINQEVIGANIVYLKTRGRPSQKINTRAPSISQSPFSYNDNRPVGWKSMRSSSSRRRR